MPTKVERHYVFKNTSGQDIVLSHEEAASQRTETDIDFVCDGPRCAARHNSDEPVKFSYREEEATKNPESLPDSFFRFIPPFLPYMGDTSVIVGFCSAQCLKDWLTYSYQPPLSPREKSKQMAAQQAETLKELNPHLIKPAGNRDRNTLIYGDGKPHSPESILTQEILENIPSHPMDYKAPGDIPNISTVTVQPEVGPDSKAYAEYRSKSCMPGCNCEEGNHAQ